MLKNNAARPLLFAAVAMGALLHGAAQAQAKLQVMERLVTINGKTAKLTSKLLTNKKILSTMFYFNSTHRDGRPNVKNWLTEIANEDGLHVDFIEPPASNMNDASGLKPEMLKDYAVFVGNSISSMAGGKDANATLTPAQKLAFEQYVEQQGGGFFIVHATGDDRSAGTGEEWPWYFHKLHPAEYQGHGQIGIFARVYQPQGPTHPVMEGLPKDATVHEEFHRFHYYITDKVPSAEILLHVDDKYPGFTCGCTPDPRGHPISWTFKLGKGTVLYTTFGHGNEVKDWGGSADNFKKFLRNGIYWSAGYDTTWQGNTGLKGKLTEYELGKGGIAFRGRLMEVAFTSPGRHQVDLIDAKGKLVAGRSGSSPEEFSFENMGLPRGLYLMRATAAKAVVTRKFVVND
jgi:type 1 glutamine amidotransferase